jgi:hypothetical protein
MTITILKNKPVRLQVNKKELVELESEAVIIKNSTVTSITLYMINLVLSLAVLITSIVFASYYIVEPGM